MSITITTTFSEAESATIDRLVAEGVGRDRSDVIRQGIEQLVDKVRRAKIGQLIADSYAAQPQSEAEKQLGVANASALVEAEPWDFDEEELAGLERHSGVT